MLFVRIELLNRIHACHDIERNSVELAVSVILFWVEVLCFRGVWRLRATHFLLAHSGGPHLPPVRLTVPGLSKALCARLLQLRRDWSPVDFSSPPLLFNSVSFSRHRSRCYRGEHYVVLELEIVSKFYLMAAVASLHEWVIHWTTLPGTGDRHQSRIMNVLL